MYLPITFRRHLRGRFEDRLEITFEDILLRQKFVIIRSLRAIVGNQADYDLLWSTKSYEPRVLPRNRVPESEVIPGPSPPAASKIEWVTRLPLAGIPRTISSILLTGSVRSVANVVNQLRRIVLPKILNTDTYGHFYKALIWIEEYRMRFVVRMLSV